MAAAAPTTPSTYISPKNGASPSDGTEEKDEEAWSEDESGDDGDGPKRKRPRNGQSGRPMSVSCELCKQRKVPQLITALICPSPLILLCRSSVTEANRIAGGVFEMAKSASTRSGRSLVFALGTEESSKHV